MITEFLNTINRVILNPLIVLIFAVALLVFFWGVYEFVKSAADGGDKDKAKKKIIYGLIGMFIMFGAYGLIRLTLSTFGISQPSYLNQ